MTTLHAERDDARQWQASPDPRLAPYIDRYWGRDGNIVLPGRLLPGTGAECLFHYAAPVLLDHRATARAVVICPRARAPELSANGRVGFVAVRFRSGRLRHLCPLALAELHDRPWSAESLWGESASRLADRIATSATQGERIAALDAFFLQRLARHEDRADVGFDAILDTLYYAPATTIEQIALHSGWTRRHILRKFTTLYGIAPKRFARLARLNHTMRRLALDAGALPLDTALDMGYFDQSHFIHDTRALTGATPSTVRGWLEHGAHFYNPPSRPLA
ncbi:helix-turn-helix domain-containing protein [Paludibacterium yongneupense]|uniref:helix-turn-helix domain-containing protein n=1 Tax=Paludibacterium yongneupense TaxID=400061 RepID=UPI00041D50F4|nr:helix-turn-helix domain-containing protein [Paludibacterium yongneupense]